MKGGITDPIPQYLCYWNLDPSINVIYLLIGGWLLGDIVRCISWQHNDRFIPAIGSWCGVIRDAILKPWIRDGLDLSDAPAIRIDSGLIDLAKLIVNTKRSRVDLDIFRK